MFGSLLQTKKQTPPSLAPICHVLRHTSLRLYTLRGVRTRTAYALQASPDLVTWHTRQTLVPPTDTFQLQDPVAPGFSKQFYRLQEQ